ncbi:MAG: hypothetical protein HOJ21_08385 [Alphaproteobacteria bacterium]|jgi:flagellar biosynthesis protein FlhF|nr:hypothetical protein [Alphaproteobacteria bacterium]
MKIHVIRAPNLPAAMRLAQAAHGEDAVILDTSEDESGASVRVGVDTDEPTPRFDSGPPLEAEPEVTATRIAAEEPEPEATPPKASKPRAVHGPNPLDVIAEALAWHGVPMLAVRNLLLAAEATDADTAEAALTQALDRVFRFGRPESLAGPVALVGPPGGGKTATVVKLTAARALAGVEVSLINTDVTTTGARERLNAFAEALGLEPEEPADVAALRACIQTAPGDHFTIVDTTGRAPADAEDLDELTAEIAAVGAAALVLPASMAPAEAAELAETFCAAGAHALIVTGLDMSRRIGALLAAADAGDLEIIGVGVGRKIGDGLKPVTSQSLARLILAPPQPIAATQRKSIRSPFNPARSYGLSPQSRPNGAAA